MHRVLDYDEICGVLERIVLEHDLDARATQELSRRCQRAREVVAEFSSTLQSLAMRAFPESEAARR